MVQKTRIPHLRKTKTSAQLIVNGEPFLMLAAELHNSSLSSAKYMSTVWQNMKDMYINTLLGSVTWEMIEPVEGQFDFSELDKVILDARSHGLHLVLLWFGSFKNATSTYVPKWVKRNTQRFPRAHIRNGHGKIETIELVSPFCKAAMEADAKAFAMLMKHLREIDEEFSTVIMVQVENESGILGDSRDRSQIANEKFCQAIPYDIVEYISGAHELHPAFNERWPNIQKTVSKGKDWTSTFGESIDAEEMFMANAFARYVGFVAAAGRQEYSLPLYANVWLNVDNSSVLDLSGISLGEGVPVVAGGGNKAGVYPSGGPCPHTIDIWRFHTVERGHVDFISPDLYLHDYEWVCKQYQYRNQPLFIPEQKADAKGARRAWLAYATYGAIGCSPFGIDSIAASDCHFTQTYKLLASMSKLILEVQAERPHDMFGFFFDEVEDASSTAPKQWRHNLGNFEVIVDRSFVFGRPGPGYGLVILLGDDKYCLVGAGFQVSFKSLKASTTFTGILSSHEKYIDDSGKLQTLRILNGDETRSGASITMPNEEPDYGGFPIRITIPARTYLAEVQPYAIEETNE